MQKHSAREDPERMQNHSAREDPERIRSILPGKTRNGSGASCPGRPGTDPEHPAREDPERDVI